MFHALQANPSLEIRLQSGDDYSPPWWKGGFEGLKHGVNCPKFQHFQASIPRCSLNPCFFWSANPYGIWQKKITRHRGFSHSLGSQKAFAALFFWRVGNLLRSPMITAMKESRRFVTRRWFLAGKLVGRVRGSMVLATLQVRFSNALLSLLGVSPEFIFRISIGLHHVYLCEHTLKCKECHLFITQDFWC